MTDVARLFDVSGKTALVTGGSRGIGAMIAEGLLRAGVRVLICARKQDELDAAQRRLESFGQISTVVADLATESGCAAVADAAAAMGDALHILVNNAGAVWSAPLETYGRDAFARVMAVNMQAPFELVQRTLPLLRAAASLEDPARVINLSSVAAIMPPDAETYAYSATKGGLAMLTRHLAAQLAHENITVNALAPGVFPSRMTAPFFYEDGTHEWQTPIARIGTMEDVAGAVIYLSSRAGAYVTGALLPVSGGLGVAEPTAARRSA